MNAIAYNVSLVVGIALITIGAGLHSIPDALIVSGALLLGMNMFGALISARRG